MRTQMLNVAVLGNRVVVSGYVRSYYVLQLVLAAVLDVVDAAHLRIELNVKVL